MIDPPAALIGLPVPVRESGPLLPGAGKETRPASRSSQTASLTETANSTGMIEWAHRLAPQWVAHWPSS